MSLQKVEQRQAVLYTLDNGILPVWLVHFYYQGLSRYIFARTTKLCSFEINYHHNFFVQSGIQHYYSGIPDILQVAEHQFVERKLVNLRITLMVVSWTSATNCARFYNVALRGDHRAPSKYRTIGS